MELIHRKLDFKSNDKVTRQVRSDELIRLYREDNIYNFFVKGLDGSWQAQNFDTGAAVSVLPRSYAKPVQRLSGGSWQALSAKVDPKLKTDMDVVKEPIQTRLALWSSLILEARSHGWVPVYTHSKPVPSSLGRLRVA